MLTRVCSALVWLPLVLPIACQSTKMDSQDQYTLIDDMENDAGARFNSPAGFPGLWYSSTPCDQRDKVTPPAYLGGENQWTFDTLETPYWTRQQSKHASRLRTNGDPTNGGGLISPAMDDSNSRDWGANMTIDLVTPPDSDAGAEPATCPPPVSTRPHPDGVALSSYSGLVFWAKASSLVDGSGEQTIYVMVHDVNSDPRGKRCNDPSFDYYATSDGKNCYNAYSKPLALSESFERYEVDFSELQRDPTWGAFRDTQLQLGQVYMIVFEVRSPKCVTDDKARCVGDAPQVLNFDFSIDDLYLVQHPPNQP